MATNPAKPHEDKPRTVTVHCSIPNGFVMSFMGAPNRLTNEGLTIPDKVHDNFKITLASGPNYGIDAAWWDRWLSENAEFSAVRSGHIYATPEE